MPTTASTTAAVPRGIERFGARASSDMFEIVSIPV